MIEPLATGGYSLASYIAIANVWESIKIIETTWVTETIKVSETVKAKKAYDRKCHNPEAFKDGALVLRGNMKRKK